MAEYKLPDFNLVYGAPIVDATGQFTATTIEAALLELEARIQVLEDAST